MAQDYLDLLVQLVDLDEGRIGQQHVLVHRDRTVGHIVERLSASSPGSEIVIRNHLLELGEDEKLAEVTEEGDTLTAFKRRSEDDDDIEEADDFFVVILSSVTKELVFLRPGEAAQLQLQEVAYNQIVSVFRSVRNCQDMILNLSSRKEYIKGKVRREEGEILFAGDKYDLAKVREYSVTS